MASGDVLAIFTPLSNEPPAANNAALDTRNSHTVLDFDAAVNESGVFKSIMPTNYSGGGVTVNLKFAMSSANTGEVKWDVSFEKENNLDTDSFGPTSTTGLVTVPATSGIVDTEPVTVTDGANLDNIVVGDGYRLKVTRDAVADTATGDAELWAVEIRET